MGRLVPVQVQAPGFFGMNTRQATTPGINWASEATNAVINAAGRLAARKGRKDVTTSPLAGTPKIQALFEHIVSDETTTVIGAANNKLYSGTTVLTEITGTAASVTGITANHWQFQTINDLAVGFQDGHDPIVRSTGNFSLLQQNISDWAATTAYVVGDVVKATSGNETIYFHCTTAGTSGGSEPTWDTTVGNTTVDATVTWTTRKFPNGNVNHSAFGRLWVTSSGDASVIEFSDSLAPQKFRGGTAGTLDLKTIWGGDICTAVSSFEDLLIIFGRRNVLIYQGAEDPTTMSLAERIQGVGCIARDTVAHTGDDIVFLANSGIRLLSRAIEAGGRQPMGDLSMNVRESLMVLVATETAAGIKAVYHEPEGFYIVTLPNAGYDYVFDFRFPNEDGTAKVTTWRQLNATALLSATDRELYFGYQGIISKYEGYIDGTNTPYSMVYRSTWFNLGSDDRGQSVAGLIKIPKRWLTTIISNAPYLVTFVWGFDYNENFLSTDAITLPIGNIAEWGLSEWGIAEWTGGDIFANPRTAAGGHGAALKVGWNVTISGAPFAVQLIDIGLKLGRMS